MTTALQPVEFTPPLIAPANPLGLDAATTWTQATEGEALHWLPSGVQIRARTHRDPGAFGIWGAPWCVDPDDLDPGDVKTGPPPEDSDPDPFAAQTVWAFDRLQECGNLSEFDRGQVIERARQTFAIREPLAVETQFATRLLADAPSPTAAADLVEAVGHLEQTFAATGTFGLIHARVGLLALAEHLRMIVRDPGAPGVLRTPAGHRWVFGAGYATPLGDTLVGTSPTYGWRDEVVVREVIQYEASQFVAIAERSVIVGYEALIGTAVITQ
ncbi:hypothetical protein [Mycolicibacterium holsaticum]|uniref:hypothetical protein n=1 Tax=Mycolicibacterium holsaticum TaxID=152142 RepID=UPI001C7D4280|nr:hypothetical protein [Mycolicibacterium holsaticum]MDA4108168.1 hypothetical protein [Mycolicibacterium holsaticum DSM 44478 = JCM 12374]QZA14423.1 hypothetical protein K3U96_10125 [Mycolicibacterium holsaticum DSM 44478 = JCM 12374]UNC08127.1 hypothetical protein H5U41_16705 [Mycolicibacterium holsaticum DSM 44478 = JCM 12374]